MSALNGALHQLHAGLTLGALPAVVFKEKGRIAADLANPGEFGKDLDLLLAGQFTARQHLLHADHLTIIDLLLFPLKMRVPHLLQLGRQILEHIRLPAAQDKRRRHGLQPVCRFLIFIFGDGQFIIPLEGCLVIQETGHEEIKDAPQLREPVLNRGAGQGIAMIRLNQLDRLGGRRPGILDILGLIQDTAGKGQIRVKGDVPLQKIIGGNEHIHPGKVAESLFPGTLGSRQDRDGQVRGKFGDLLLPVIDQGRRADHQGRLARLLFSAGLGPFILVFLENGDHLQGFPQTHLIRQDSAESGALQRFQPFIAIHLIRPHHVLKGGGNLKFRIPDRLEIPDQGTVGAVPGAGQLLMILQHPVQIQCPVHGDLQLAVDDILGEQLHLRHERAQFTQLFILCQVHKVAALQAVIALFLHIAVVDIKELPGREFFGNHGNVQQAAAVNRDADLNRRTGDDAFGQEAAASLDLSVIFQFRKPHGQEIIQAVIRQFSRIAVRLLLNRGRPPPDALQRPLLLLHVMIPSAGLLCRNQRILKLIIPDNAADGEAVAVIQIQIKGKVRFRGQITGGLIHTVVHKLDERVFKQPWQNAVIKLLQPVLPYLEAEIAGGIRHRDKRGQHRNFLIGHAGEAGGVDHVFV